MHLVLLTDAHLNFDLSVVGQRGNPRVSDEQRELVVGFLQTVQKHDLGVCGCGRHAEEEGDLMKGKHSNPPSCMCCPSILHLTAAHFARQN